MFPASSSTFLVGEKARSTAALITRWAPPSTRTLRAGAGQAYGTGRRAATGGHGRSARRAATGEPAWSAGRFSLAVSASRLTCGIVAVGLTVAACGGQKTQNAGEPRGDFRVQVASASFPAHQRLAEQTDLVLAVRNAGPRAVPDISVTLLNPRYGTSAEALGRLIAPGRPGQPILASRSRPVWVIDQAPGACGYSCRQGGAGAAATAYSDTWALGRLAPGATARFDWHVTAVQPGSFTVAYEVAADPNGGSARAIATAGDVPVTGSFRVTISNAVPKPYVTASGQVVYR